MLEWSTFYHITTHRLKDLILSLGYTSRIPEQPVYNLMAKSKTLVSWLREKFYIVENKKYFVEESCFVPLIILN